jgi:hypothetical protein
VTLSSVLAVVALIVAAAALVKARDTARRFEGLSEAYWQLRYEYGQLASSLRRLEQAEPPPAAEENPGPRPVQTAFVPLSSLKR